MNELPEDLSRAFDALDARAARRAARVDPSRVAARVLARLRTKEAPSHRVLSFGYRLAASGYRLAAVAAMLAVLVIGGSVARTAFQRDASRVVAVPVRSRRSIR